jgi:hypothetical protein
VSGKIIRVKKYEDIKVWRGRNDTGEELAIQFDEVTSPCKSCYYSHILQHAYFPVVPFDLDLRDVPLRRLRLVAIIVELLFRYSLTSSTNRYCCWVIREV